MTAIDFNEDKFTHRRQIVQLLQLAIDKSWRFTYMALESKKVISYPVILLSVNVDSSSLIIDRDLAGEGCSATEPELE